MISCKNKCAKEIKKEGIGSFGDKRLDNAGIEFFNAMCKKQTVILRQLASYERGKEVKYGRFLRNKKVTMGKVNMGMMSQTNTACLGVAHVICVTDTVESTYPNQPIKKSSFGASTNQETKGIFTHGSVVLNAQTKEVLGPGHINAWHRTQSLSERNAVPKRNKTTEEKESSKWLKCANLTKAALTNPSKITFVSDRESDIIEYLSQAPDSRTDVIVRARHDRYLEKSENKLSEQLLETPVSGTISIELPRNHKHKKARKTKLEIRYFDVTLQLPEEIDRTIQLSCVQALEVGQSSENEPPISWVLLTTHTVNSFQKACQILNWYTWRWTIEEVHRTMKRKGLCIEESQIETPEELLKLSIICFASAVKVMTLVNARDGSTQKASDIFSKNEIKVLKLCNKKIQGKTEKQKNKFEESSMGWAAWIIARLGGWKGYKSEAPPGPITMHNGLKSFYQLHQGWAMAIEMCA